MKNHNSTLTLLLLACVFMAFGFQPNVSRHVRESLISNAQESGDIWPMRMHDLGRTGFSEETVPTLLVAHDIWVRSGIVDLVVGDSLFGSSQGGTSCMSDSTGSVIWQCPNASGLLCYADGKVFVSGQFNGSQSMTCLNAVDGSLVWSTRTPVFSIGYPTVSQGRVFETVWFSYLGTGAVYCFSESNGDMLWQYPLPDASYQCPVVYGGRLTVGCRSGVVYCFDPVNGNLIWNKTIVNFIEGVSAHSGRLFITTADYDGSANNNLVVCLDPSDGHELWRYVIGERSFSIAAIAYGKVYVGTGRTYGASCKFVALDESTGTFLWKLDGVGYFVSPTIADGKIFLPITGGGEDKLYCLNATDGSVIWPLVLPTSGCGEPIIANHKVYFYYNGATHCLGDNHKPSMDDPIQSPLSIVPSDVNVAVSIRVVDVESGLNEVLLMYAKDGEENWTNLTMTYNQVTGLYETNIPSQPFGTLVKYKIVASDNAGNIALKDNEGNCYSYRVGLRSINVAVLLAKFSDNNPAPTHDANFYLQGSNSLVANLQRYYSNISYNSVRLNLEFFNESNGAWRYSVDHDRVYYGSGKGNDPSDVGNRENQFTIDSIGKADTDVNFTSFDIVVVLHSGYDEAQGNSGGAQSDMWSQYFPQTLTTPDGDTVNNRIVLSEMDPMGTWAHEIGHALGKVITGSPLYDRYGSSGNGEVGEWDLMGSGSWRVGNTGERPSHMSTYNKRILGWISPSVKGYGTYDLSSIETLSYGDVDNTIIFYPGGLPFKPGFTYYLIESRTAISSYGQWQNEWWAPDSGIVLYEVTQRTFSPEFVDKITPPNHNLDESTLKSSGDFYLDPFSLVNFSFVQRGPKVDGYYSKVAVEPWTPINLVGVKLSQILSSIFEPRVASNLTLSPDLDLHAFTPDGKHVGMNYTTGIYENQIQGAIASGDLIGADEWIFVPWGLNVTYSISSHDVGEFLEVYPQFQSQFQQQAFNVTYMYFDKNGDRTDAKLESMNISSNSTLELPRFQADTVAPAIDLPVRNPSGDPQAFQEVRVSANVTDAVSGVKNVTLRYTTDNWTTWTDLPMNYNVSTNLFEATIPGQPLGNIVKLKILAYDNAENNATREGAESYFVYRAVPEYPAITIIPILTLMTLLAAVSATRRRKKRIDAT